MSWKFWKRNKEPEYVTASHTVPLSTLFRWYCYDLRIDNPNKIAEAVGLTPISSEGEEMERRDSDLRVLRVLPYMNFFNTIADINSIALSESQMSIFDNLVDTDGASKEELDDIMERIVEVYKLISISALVAGFSSAFALDLVSNANGAFVTEGVLDDIE